MRRTIVQLLTPMIQLFANLTSNRYDPGEFAKFAEDAGFDGATCSDHYWMREAAPHVWVALAAMGCATQRITIAPSFVNNLARSPFEFVQASVAMHRLSGGRFEAGLGAGWNENEIVATGQTYPSGPQRARMYREALLIARQLLTEGRCTFDGEHYRMEVPFIEALRAPEIPLVASVGGSWTMRHITPIVDRVELKFGRTTRGGSLDIPALASVTQDELVGMIAAVREVRPDIPIGLFVLFAAGEGAAVEAVRASMGDNLCAEFVGDPKRVLDRLRSLESLGIGRVQLTELVPGSLERLGEAL